MRFKQFLQSAYLKEEPEEWPADTVVRVVDDGFTVARTMDPQEHMRRMNSGQHGMPHVSFKYGELFIILGYSDSGEGYWDVLFDYFDEKKRGRDYFVCPEPAFRRAVVKDDKAWMNSLKEENEYWEKECWVIKPFEAAYAEYGGTRVPFNIHDVLVFGGYTRDNKKAFFSDENDRVYKVEREIFDSSVTFDKREAGKKWIDSLKEEEEKPTFDDYEIAAQAAVDFYQSECDSHNRENGSDFQSRATVNDFSDAKFWWNPATKEFIIPVIDNARDSMDDGVHVHVDAKGSIISVVNGPPKKSPIEKLTNDPDMIKKIQDRLSTTRNRFVEFNPDDI